MNVRDTAMHSSAQLFNRAFCVILASFSITLLVSVRGSAADTSFLRGDANIDGEVSLSDTLMLRRWLFNGGAPPVCRDSADANDDGKLDVSDPIKIMQRLFLGGTSFPIPYSQVGTDPTTDEVGCDSYEVIPPEATEDVIRIGDVSALPGEDVLIPIHITSTHDTEAFQLVISYDPTLFTPRDDLIPGLASSPYWPEVIQDSVNETPYTELYSSASGCSSAFFKIVSYPEEGVFTVGFVPSFVCVGYELAPVNDAIAFNILGTVPASAPPGTTIMLEPTNGPNGEGFGPDKLHNELTYQGGARFLSVHPLTIPGLLRVVPDIAIFVRGDANSDAAIDMSDPISTLGFLFLGDAEPACLDGADANDDGIVNITDPVATLMYLFDGGAQLPAPWGTAGEDPTADGLDCLRSL